MTDLPRSIYLDLTGIRLAKRRAVADPAPVRRLVPVPVERPRAEAEPVDTTHDAEILRLLEIPALPGESTDGQHRRKEQLLGELFSRLGIDAAEALHQRLVTGCATDLVCVQFGRLLVERRERLLAFLRGARRRAVIESARRPHVVRGAAR